MKTKIVALPILIILFVAAPAATAKAQTIDEGFHPGDFERIAQSGWQFLKIPTSARVAGMGGIVTATSHGDASSALANPASIVDVKNWSVLFNNLSWIADIDYTSGAVVKNLGDWGYWGLTFIYVDFGEMIRTENREILFEGQSTGLTEIVTDLGTFGAHDLAIGVSYARNITERLQVGVNLSYIEEQLDDARTANWSVNVGTVYYTGLETFRIAMVGRNFGPDVEFAKWDERIGIPPAQVRMPMNFSFGGAFDVLEGGEGSPHLWTVAAEFIHANDGPEKLNVGTEYTFQNLLILRGGYRFNYDEESLTLGAGLRVAVQDLSVSINYAYWNFGILGSTNTLSIDLGL